MRIHFILDDNKIERMVHVGEWVGISFDMRAMGVLRGVHIEYIDYHIQKFWVDTDIYSNDSIIVNEYLKEAIVKRREQIINKLI